MGAQVRAKHSKMLTSWKQHAQPHKRMMKVQRIGFIRIYRQGWINKYRHMLTTRCIRQETSHPKKPFSFVHTFPSM